MSAREESTKIGRYDVFAPFASGGMATVHLGRVLRDGHVRAVAIKRLHEQLASQADFVAGLIEEARIASKVQHPNVVSVIDVVEERSTGVSLVMEYVEGVALSRLLKRSIELTGRPAAPSVAAAIMIGALRGLHAAHEATTADGEPLGIVHRDVSPQNVLVDRDGVTRIVDFGVAKAIGRLVETTVHGHIKGKLPYMAPEQMRPGMVVTRRADVFAVGVVLWEILVGRRLFGDDDVSRAAHSASAVRAPSTFAPDVPPALDEVVLRALAANPRERFETAQEMAEALESAVRVAPASEVARFVQKVASDELREHAARLATIEREGVIVPAREEPSIAPPPIKYRPARSRLGVIVAAALALGAIALVVANRAPREETAVVPAPPPIVASPEPEVAAAPPSTVEAVDERPPPPARDEEPRTSATPKKRAAPRRRAADPRGCAQRFEIVDGIKVFKPECLR